MKNINLFHRPVMLKKVIELINKKEKNGIHIDCTFGSGGHAKKLLKVITKNGILIAIDKDPTAIKIAKNMSLYDKRVKFYRGSFMSVNKISKKYNLTGKINNIIVDLGISNMQLNNSLGFSFQKNSVLDMRMDPTYGIPAYKWINNISKDQMSKILKTYGEEKYHVEISQAIKLHLKHNTILNSLDLVNVIYNAIPIRYFHTHFATKTFQAIRIAINNELYELKKFLLSIPHLLSKNGKLNIMSFHSLEDRIVKNFYKNNNISSMKQIVKNIPTIDEVTLNKQSRSAILRVFKKV